MVNIIKINKSQPLDSTVIATCAKLSLESNLWASGFTPICRELGCYHSQRYNKKKQLLLEPSENLDHGELLPPRIPKRGRERPRMEAAAEVHAGKSTYTPTDRSREALWISLKVKNSKGPSLREGPTFMSFTSRSPTMVSWETSEKNPLLYQQREGKINHFKTTPREFYSLFCSLL